MGIYSNLLAGGKAFDVVVPIDAGAFSGVVYTWLKEQIAKGDVDLPAAYAAGNEVQSIAFNTLIDGGTFTLTVTLDTGETYTTAAIAFGANAATIQTALDTASPASVANASVVVTGGNIATANVVLTFSGAYVANRQHPVVIVGNSLTDGGVAVDTPVVSTTTQGKPNRNAMAALYVTGAISGTVPAAGAAPADWVKGNRGVYRSIPSNIILKALADQMGVEERTNDARATVYTLWDLR